MLAFERVQAEQIHPGSTHNIVIRWPGIEIDSGMMVSAETGNYEIQGVVDIDGEAQYLQLICTKKTQRVGVESTR
jgi:SPP1 family predicted phage head-tail adaptor